MKRFLVLFFITAAFFVPAFSITYPVEVQRNSVNIAKDTEQTQGFLLEKQIYDTALSRSIEFYPLDSWYFELFLKKHTDIELKNLRLNPDPEGSISAQEAYNWYQEIAQGNTETYMEFAPYAQYITALCLKEQLGTVKNYALARKFISQSYASGFAGGCYLMALQKKEGWAVKGADGNKEETLLGNAASQNFPEALLDYADLYGDYSVQDAKNLLKRASKYNDSRAYLLLGSEEKASELGNAQAYMNLAEKSEQKHNYTEALDYYTMAATYGECEGFARAARIYREGLNGKKDPALASFFYYQYRDAKYEKEKAAADKVLELRKFYEFENNEPDETVCRDLGMYYYEYPDEYGTVSGTEWFTRGAEKGSAECKLQLAMRHKKNKEGLSLYRQTVAESNAFPLGTDRLRNAYSQIDDIYAQVLQASRFKNDVEYWNNPSKEKRTIDIDRSACQAASRKEALAWFKSRSLNGDSFLKTWYAWILIEDMNAQDYGIPAISKKADKDVNDAYKLITEILAKDPDYAPALVCLGRCYRDGYGVKKKTREARNSFQKSIDLNYSEGYGHLAQMLTDKAELQEILEAGCKALDELSFYTAYQKLVWTEEITDLEEHIVAAAHYGYTPAFLQLVDCYIKNTAVTFDGNYKTIDEAHLIASRAEALGVTNARAKRLYMERSFSAKMKYTSYTCSQKIAEAREIFQRNRSAESAYNLAEAYDSAKDLLDSTDSQAAKYYLLAAEQGNVEAMKKIAEFYYSGRGIAPSYENAFKWYSTALENGSSDIYGELGEMYLNGKGCDREVDLGIGCYRKAVRLDPDSKVQEELNFFDGI